MDYVHIINQLRLQFETYIKSNNIQAIVIGISGGLDSAVNAALVKPICDKNNIPLYGEYIHISSNKDEERERAKKIGECFCTHFIETDLTELFLATAQKAEERYDISTEDVMERAIRRGNIKARIRMEHLRDLAQHYKGLCIDNTNQTEWQLGFFTLNDNMDLSPLYGLFKTEEYNLAKVLVNMCHSQNEKDALNACINAIPTDGLGISNSDLEQMGCESYEEVDDILKNLLPLENTENCSHNNDFQKMYDTLCIKYTTDKVNAVWSRHCKTKFKRNGTVRLIIYKCR